MNLCESLQHVGLILNRVSGDPAPVDLGPNGAGGNLLMTDFETGTITELAYS